LAAARLIKQQLSYCTLKIEAANLSVNHPDLTIPAALLNRLGLKHNIIESPKNVDEQFSNIFKQNVTLAHEIWSLDAQAIFYFYRLRKVVISGSVSEIARNFYVLPRYVEKKITAEKLASLAGMGSHPFAVRCSDGWLGKLGKTYNLRTLDLFYWEQRVGNWVAMCQKEFDIAWQEIFSPFDCRLLLMTMLSVKNKYRRAPKFPLYKEIMLALWPEVLKDPINPHKMQSPARRIKVNLRNQLSNVKHFISRQ
jgi:hypothetical protein